MTPNSLETTRERKETRGERGEKKKSLLALIIFILPLDRAVPFSKIQVYVSSWIFENVTKTGTKVRYSFAGFLAMVARDLLGGFLSN